MAKNYGGRAVKVLEFSKNYSRLSRKHPYILAKIYYAKEYEMAQTAEDVLHRRTRLDFVDQKESKRVKDLVEKILHGEK